MVDPVTRREVRVECMCATVPIGADDGGRPLAQGRLISLCRCLRWVSFAPKLNKSTQHECNVVMYIHPTVVDRAS